jgi:rare lipoprotein A
VQARLDRNVGLARRFSRADQRSRWIMGTTALALLAALVFLAAAGPVLPQDSDDAVVFQEEGQASYYGPGFDGRPTASGERFDQDAMTAAHPKLPLGTEVTGTRPVRAAVRLR